jgi:hypothetical protein
LCRSAATIVSLSTRTGVTLVIAIRLLRTR